MDMQAKDHRTTPDQNLTGYPSGVPYIIGNEGCERFSYYGMKAILVVYIAGLHVNLYGVTTEAAQREALATYHMFGAAVYLIPLLGGLLADRLLGKYRTILSLSVVYCLGHLALAIFEDPALQQDLLGQVYLNPLHGMYLGLGLIALGSGGIKPCVSAHVGDQFGRSNKHLLQNIFNAFYFIINFGSAFATLIIPWIRGKLIIDPVTGMQTYEGSVGLAFGVPGILMGLATIFFWMGRRVFIHVPPSVGGKLGLLDVLAGTALFVAATWNVFIQEIFASAVDNPSISGPLAFLIPISAFMAFVAIFAWRQKLKQDDGFLAILFYCLTKRGQTPDPSAEPGSLEASPFWGTAVKKFGKEATEGPIAVLKIVSVFFLVSFFWALFDQHSSTWIQQAQAMNRVVDFSLGNASMMGGFLGVIVGGAFALTMARNGSARTAWLALGLVGGVLCGVGASYIWPNSLELEASQVPAANPFLVMILIPYTTFGLYPLMEKFGYKPHPLRRMTIGMFMASAAFVVVALIQAAIETSQPGSVHVGWQMIAYLVLTLSEVMVSITGLEFAYSQAPKRMKSVIMSFWLFFVGLGQLYVVFLAKFQGLSLQDFFWVFAALMGVAAGIFGLRARFYRYKEFTQ